MQKNIAKICILRIKAVPLRRLLKLKTMRKVLFLAMIAVLAFVATHVFGGNEEIKHPKWNTSGALQIKCPKFVMNQLIE